MPHYFDEKQEGPFKPFPITIRLFDMTFDVQSASGVFSLRHLDKGTETLIKYCSLPEARGASVLDLGCGYGVVAFVTKRRRQDILVTASDVNERALNLTKLNADELSLDIQVVKSDLFAELESFDCILTNPPYVAGRKTLFSLIEQAKEHINE
ncbi:methyltransferase, partial [Candidatus Woesearchaeota archaeon]|nr:methyltransferase [Candidatus Woesearchaeota archaeon]